MKIRIDDSSDYWDVEGADITFEPTTTYSFEFKHEPIVVSDEQLREAEEFVRSRLFRAPPDTFYLHHTDGVPFDTEMGDIIDVEGRIIEHEEESELLALGEGEDQCQNCSQE